MFRVSVVAALQTREDVMRALGEIHRSAINTYEGRGFARAPAGALVEG